MQKKQKQEEVTSMVRVHMAENTGNTIEDHNCGYGNMYFEPNSKKGLALILYFKVNWMMKSV